MEVRGGQARDGALKKVVKEQARKLKVPGKERALRSFEEGSSEGGARWLSAVPMPEHGLAFTSSVGSRITLPLP